MRIVSLLPSATDLVCTLGLRDALVGRTHECDWPPGIEDVPVMTRDMLDTKTSSSAEIDRAVGGAVHSGSSIYALDRDAMREARPDVILTQELCRVCAVSYREVAAAARMIEAEATVVSLEPRSIAEILGHVELVGRLCGVEDRGREVVGEAHDRLEAVRRAVDGKPAVPTACIEWLDPIYAAGHWVPEQVERAGGVELIGRAGKPSEIVGWDKIVSARPAGIVLMPCGLPIERTRAELPSLLQRPGWPTLPAVEHGRVWVVDGSSFFNRPGPRVIRGVEILAALLHGTGDVSPDEAFAVGSS